MKKQVNIRPGVSVLSVLRHLNYQPWYALAEFVDNSIQSFSENFDALIESDGRGYVLHVAIALDPSAGTIAIRDNAAGIRASDYERAFRPASPPPNSKGLSEFGMGMKSAACWFAPEWRVTTTALGENVRGSVDFDINRIVNLAQEDIGVTLTRCDVAAHYTELLLLNVYKMPQGKTIAKIKDHLSSIYRQFLRRGRVRLSLNGELLAFDDPPVLVAPYWKTPDASSVDWRKEVDIRLPEHRRVHGFAALRERGSTAKAGFALFRRGRVIQGSGDEGYRPAQIFGRSNSYSYQRLFGELHFEGFDVSHTKDGIRWDEIEDLFLDRLRVVLNADPLPLLEQAEGYRVRPTRGDAAAVATKILDRTAKVVADQLPAALERISQTPPELAPPGQLDFEACLARRTIEVQHNHQSWRIEIEVGDQGPIEPWLDIAETGAAETEADGSRRLSIRVNATHPFMLRYCGADLGEMEGFIRLAAGMSVAESAARLAGVRMVGTVRRYLNELLREALAQ